MSVDLRTRIFTALDAAYYRGLHQRYRYMTAEQIVRDIQYWGTDKFVEFEDNDLVPHVKDWHNKRYAVSYMSFEASQQLAAEDSFNRWMVGG